jgi:hypothetical protein
MKIGTTPKKSSLRQSRRLYHEDNRQRRKRDRLCHEKNPLRLKGNCLRHSADGFRPIRIVKETKTIVFDTKPTALSRRQSTKRQSRLAKLKIRSFLDETNLLCFVSDCICTFDDSLGYPDDLF